MSIIGNVKFNKKDGSYRGRLSTMSVNAAIEIIPVKKKEKPEHPDYMVFVQQQQLGAAWNRTGEKSGKPYVSGRIEDPELSRVLPMPLYFNLGPDSSQSDPEVLAIFWNASKKKGI